MKAYGFREYGSKEVLEKLELPIPKPGDDETLIKVKASSVNPLDIKIRKGLFKFLYPSKFPRVLGFDVAGIVAKDSLAFKKGEKIYGSTIFKKNGANAQFCSTKNKNIAKIPKGINYEKAASLPMVALTALQGLKKGKIRIGQDVLIIGASGGVGSQAVQIAKKVFDCKVTAVCSSKNTKYIKRLGADKVIAYDKEGLHIHSDYDLVFNCSGHYDYYDFNGSLKPKGHYVTTIPTARVFLSKFNIFDSRTASAIIVHPCNDELNQISQWIKSKKLKATVTKSYKLSELKKAHEALSKGTRGKIVVNVP